MKRSWPVAIALSVDLSSLCARSQVPIGPALPHQDVMGQLGPSPAYAAEVHLNHNGMLGVVVKAGDWVRLKKFFNLGSDCQPVSIQIETKLAPLHGHLSITAANSTFGKMYKIMISHSKSDEVDPRLACPDGEYAGKQVVYTADAGYVGPDEAVIVIRDRRYVLEERSSFKIAP